MQNAFLRLLYLKLEPMFHLFSLFYRKVRVGNQGFLTHSKVYYIL